MTNIFTYIAGVFTRAVIISAFLPAVIFVALWLLFVEPLFPSGRSILSSLGLFGEAWQVISLLSIGVILAVLLYTLNTQIIRFFEGYPWKDSWIGKQRIKLYLAEYRYLKGRELGMRTLLRSLDQNDQAYIKIRDEWSRLSRILKSQYPGDINRLLPTRLGNTIRSFEYYPEEQYGMEPIAIWTRLTANIDKDYATGIADTKISFDFMIHSSMLSTLLAIASLLLGLIFPGRGPATSAQALTWILQVFFFTLTSYVCYLFSIPRANAWGEMVKGAFDLYRWNMLKQLGYPQIPKTRTSERDLWDKISRQMVYGDSPEGPLIDYEIPEEGQIMSASGLPEDVELKISRGVLPIFGEKGLQVILKVKNADLKRHVKKVTITDTLPEGYYYVWGSASRNDSPVDAEGVNPYSFSFGDLSPEEAAILSYRVITRQILRDEGGLHGEDC